MRMKVSKKKGANIIYAWKHKAAWRRKCTSKKCLCYRKVGIWAIDGRAEVVVGYLEDE